VTGAGLPILTLDPGGDGWRRDGASWEPPGPFYAVLGDPVAHSLSPLFQGAALRAAGLPYAYHAVHATDADLARVFLDRGELGLRGFNVTIPHKLAAAERCATLTGAARTAGAVNTVRLGGAGWEGHNTDLGGLAEVLDGLLGGTPAGCGLVLGAGGAARAAVAALLASGTERVRVLARPGPGHDAFAAWLAGDGPADRDVALAAWGVAPDIPPDDCVCVSCVPAGVDVSFLAPAPGRPPLRLWLDMNWGDRRVTPPGVPADRVHDGLPVLLAQGALAFRWWFDREPPRGAMADALAGF